MLDNKEHDALKKTGFNRDFTTVGLRSLSRHDVCESGLFYHKNTTRV